MPAGWPAAPCKLKKPLHTGFNFHRDGHLVRDARLTCCFVSMLVWPSVNLMLHRKPLSDSKKQCRGHTLTPCRTGDRGRQCSCSACLTGLTSTRTPCITTRHDKFLHSCSCMRSPEARPQPRSNVTHALKHFARDRSPRGRPLGRALSTAKHAMWQQAWTLSCAAEPSVSHASGPRVYRRFCLQVHLRCAFSCHAVQKERHNPHLPVHGTRCQRRLEARA
jgi:hypothetical protein